MLKIDKKYKKHTKLVQQFPPTVKQLRLNINVRCKQFMNQRIRTVVTTLSKSTNQFAKKERQMWELCDIQTV